MKIKLYSADDIVLQTIKEKHSFESHKDDISYAGHHNKTWLHIDSLIEAPLNSNRTITLSELKKIIDKQLKVK